MEEELREKLLEQKISLDAALERFLNNEEMYITFLHKFSKDSNYENMKRCMEEEDIDNAFLYAHTMKGVAANMGLEGLLVVLNPLVEALRAEDMEAAQGCMGEFEENYLGLCDIIDQLA